MVRYLLYIFAALLTPVLCAMEKEEKNPAFYVLKLDDEVIRFYCNYCGKKETQGRFLICPRCKESRYCSRECQKADWSRHKPLCPTEKEELKSQARTASQERAALTKVFDSSLKKIKVSSLEFSQEEKQKINDLSLVAYAEYVKEECLAAKKSGNEAKFQEQLELFARLLVTKHFYDPLILQFQEHFYLRRFFSPRAERTIGGKYKENEKARQDFDAFEDFFTLIEWTKEQATLFKKHHYGPEVERALEVLRRKIIAFSMNNQGLCNPPIKEYILASVYALACTIGCVKDGYAESFCNGITQENPIKLLMSLDYTLIVEKMQDSSYLKGSQVFLPLIQKYQGDKGLKAFNLTLNCAKELLAIIRHDVEQNKIPPYLYVSHMPYIGLSFILLLGKYRLL